MTTLTQNSVPDLKCTACGADLLAEARFCEQCGTPVVVSAPPPPANMSPPERPAQTSRSTASVPEKTTSGVAPLSVGQYLGMMILMYIPVLNIILLLAWSFSGNVNPNKRNLARAFLLIMVVVIMLGIVFTLSTGF